MHVKKEVRQSVTRILTKWLLKEKGNEDKILKKIEEAPCDMGLYHRIISKEFCDMYNIKDHERIYIMYKLLNKYLYDRNIEKRVCNISERKTKLLKSLQIEHCIDVDDITGILREVFK